MLSAAGEEQTENEENDKVVEADNEKSEMDMLSAEMRGSRDWSVPTAPYIEACTKEVGKVDCKNQTDWKKIVALAAKHFDKGDWNTIKVILPVLDPTDKMLLRVKQAKTECYCCNDFAVDSFQFLKGDECGM